MLVLSVLAPASLATAPRAWMDKADPPAVRADPLIGSNVNYLKLQTLALSRFARVLFLDLDVVVVGDLSFLLAQPHELVGYRSCTAPVNSGLFVVRPSQAHLRELMTITRRNGCPRAARGEFARVGYDGYGPIAAELRATCPEAGLMLFIWGVRSRPSRRAERHIGLGRHRRPLPPQPPLLLRSRRR